MTDCTDFIFGYPSPQREVMLYLHRLFTGFPGVVGKITYKIPFYYRKTWVCYLNPTKNGAVELGFTRGAELQNESGLLQAKGRKTVSSVTFATPADIPEETLLQVWHEALLLDETVPYSVKKFRKN
ncbi:DUF1801 domain-containing protein [Sphingobacteriales bacterium UPWRP_1]|nr:hypothetical protein B6N25_16005 [Sphingobacteriales bacterium TSM_CSS]PSJ74089.1 DUF1801 domain-containing protein [Sphingobacteriales bacterium UPWRP_1]